MEFSKALLGKWLWRFGLEESRLWRRVVVARYGVTKGSWCTGIVRGSHGCGLWKGIMPGWDNFAQQVELRVGDGTRVRLWPD